MLKLIYFIILCVTITRAANNSYIVEISYNVTNTNKNIAMVFDYIVKNVPELELDKQLNTADFIQLTKLNNITLKSFEHVVDDLNLSESFGKQAFKKALEDLRYNISTLSNDFVNAFGILLNSTNVFNIDYKKFMAEVYADNDAGLWKLVENGTFTESKIKEFIKVNKYDEDRLFEFFRNAVVPRLPAKFSDFIKFIGNKNIVSEIIEVQGITEKDISSPKLQNLFKEFDEKLEVNKALGVYTSSDLILTHKEVYGKYQSSYVKIQILNNQSQVFEPRNAKVVNAYALLQVNVKSSSYIAKMSEYNSTLQNCLYTTGSFKNGFNNTNVQVTKSGNGAVVAKKFGLVFQKGGPLICNNVLVGLATDDEGDKIYFPPINGSTSVFGSAVLLVTLLLSLLKM